MLGARQQDGGDALGDLRPPRQPRPLDARDPGVGQAEQQAVALRLLPRRGEHSLGDRVAAAGEQAPEPGHAVGEEHSGVVDRVDDPAQAPLGAVPVARAQEQQAAVHVEVVGVRPEAALAGEGQAVASRSARARRGARRAAAARRGWCSRARPPRGGAPAMARPMLSRTCSSPSGSPRLHARDAEVVQAQRGEVHALRRPRQAAGASAARPRPARGRRSRARIAPW